MLLLGDSEGVRPLLTAGGLTGQGLAPGRDEAGKDIGKDINNIKS